MQGSILFADQNKAVTEQLSKAALQALITRERAQKLELLVHLINNLNQPLLLCGADGIGKTTLLKTLIANYSIFWPICSLDTTQEYGLDSILEQFFQQLQHVCQGSQRIDLANTLVDFQNKNQKVVLIIDNAGLLVPGLITDLVRFAAANPCVRLIFSLTHDELHVKRNSDACIDECHFIDIPPLNDKQCTVFLQNLSVQHKFNMPLDSVNDEFAAKLFRTSHGIPGKIIQQIQLPIDEKPRFKNYWSMALLVILGMVVTGGVIYLLVPNTQNSAMSTATRSIIPETKQPQRKSPPIALYQSVLSQSDVLIGDSFEGRALVSSQLGSDLYSSEPTHITESVQLTAEPQIQSGQKIEPVSEVEVNEAAIANESPDVQPIQQVKENEPGLTAEELQGKALVSKTEVTAEQQPDENKLLLASAGEVDLNWLKEQKPDDYTLQLMVLSNKAAVTGVLKKYPELRNKVRYFTSHRAGQSRYLLVYHAYSSSKDAIKAKKKLPKEMRNAWVRSFKGLQRQFAAN